MSSNATQRKRDRIDHLLEHLEERWDGTPPAALDTFLRRFYQGAAAADVADTPLETLYGAALSAWHFVETWMPGRAKVRVYAPTLEEHGWHSPHTVIEILNDDMPFLVDSVTAELRQRDIGVQQVVHPVYAVRRDASGHIEALQADTASFEDSHHESYTQVQVHAQPKETFPALERALAEVLAHVRASVTDWRAMLARCRAIAEQLRDRGAQDPGGDAQESADLLDWLMNDHFTYIGFRTVAFEGEGAARTGRVEQDSGLGILRDPTVQLFDGMLTRRVLPPDVHQFLDDAAAIRIVKANLRSPVHRPVLLDIVAVKERDETGTVVRAHLLVGLFTSKAYAATPMQVPVLRWKVTRTLAQADVPPHTHDGRAVLHILNTYPRDALFEISEDELVPTVLGILDLKQRPRTALFVRIDPFERSVSCLVYTPRDIYDTKLRRRYQRMLTEAWHGELADYSTHVDESPLARLHVSIRTDPDDVPEVDVEALERALAEVGRSWHDRLTETLLAEHGEEHGIPLQRRYENAFPAAFRDVFNEQEAVVDIGHLEGALEGDGLALNLYRPLEAAEDVLRFKVYAVGPLTPLSDFLPMLENIGFRVLAEEPYRIRPRDEERPVWIRDLVLQTPEGRIESLADVRERLHDVFRRVWQGDLDNDGFNRLVLAAGLGARDITVLRAYCRYLLQARIPFSQTYIEQTLASQPEIVRRLVALFHARFDPARGEHADDRVEALVEEIKALLNEVSNLDMDRIIRRYLEAIRLTLRTNHFQTDAEGRPKPWLSLKFASDAMKSLPLPRPFREIFVFSPRVEAVHLRGGQVARGGLRWSDRPEDFRTEVLGLMKAQMVKNTVIVPVGSKGGFVVRRLPPPDAGREAVMAEVVAAYRTMIRGMLDVTDNIEGGAIVPPRDVVRHDADDPYLVVAADKGTATFSDIANGVSRDYGFWLDDAFASGGSAGYDHKEMGITAKGAWVCVQRHFRELGKDIQSEDFTVLGVGDMSGDVFGNGMLLSEHIRLLGAFNHLHVFLDPNPDAAASFRERKRLYELPRSSWADYDPALISEGGGVFPRSLKSIPISPQVKKALHVDADELTPNELIHAMLQAPVELLWFGGIGTYVKATGETNADADDRANDAVRVDAGRLGAKVVGEGANLALTQRGRIEAGLRGVRLNTDALDNSAGVDCSDHEVNIKILLGAVERAGDLTRKRRDRVLEEMTDEVADLVLRDNYLQSQAITIAHEQGAGGLDRMGRFMRALEKEGRLDRTIEFLPDEATLTRRAKEAQGLSRPELSVLLAYAKIVLYDELLPTTLPDEPWMADEVVRYFPTLLRKQYREAIGEHSLRREIAATVVTNAILNRVGITFVREMKERTGFPADDIARATIAARDVLGLPALWREIEALDNRAPAALQTEMLVEASKTVEQVVVWMLRELPRPLDVPGIVRTYRDGVRELSETLGDLLPASHRISYERRAHRLVEHGAPESLADQVVGLRALAPACDVVRIATTADLPVRRAAEVYYGVGEAYGFDWLQTAARDVPQDTAWAKIAVQAVVDDLYRHQGAITDRVLEIPAEEDERAVDLIERWSRDRSALVERTRQLFAELSATPRPDLAMMAVAVRQMGALTA